MHNSTVFGMPIMRATKPEDDKPDKPVKPAPALLPDEVLESLAPYHPMSGQPLASVAEHFELPVATQLRGDQDMDRFRRWNDLGDRRAQLAAQVRWGKENSPLWLVQLVGTGNVNPGQPAVILHAPSEAEAAFRYHSLIGVTGYDHDVAETLVSPYTPSKGGQP
jgi:hypothetical protein